MGRIKEKTIAINPNEPLKIGDIPAGFFFEYNGEAYVKLGAAKLSTWNGKGRCGLTQKQKYGFFRKKRQHFFIA